MKTKIFIIIICCILGTKLNKAQEIFPTSDAIWNIQRFVNSSIQNEWIYGLSGDTIFNNEIYHKLYLLNDTTLVIDSKDILIGGFRLENKKVWFRPFTFEDTDFDKINESLLYDFSKQVGDTITRFIYFPSPFDPENFIAGKEEKCIVKEIKETANYRIYVVEGENTDEWIEGIGSKFGVFGNNYAIPLDYNTYSFKLACFKQNGEIQYLENNNCNKCFCTNGMNIQQKKTEEIHVYYSSIDHCIKIKTTNLRLPVYFELIDTQGRIIINQKIESSPCSISFNKKQKDTFLYRINCGNYVLKTGKIKLK